MSRIHTCTATLTSCMCERKCPNILNWRLTGLYPTISLVHSQCNVWFIPLWIEQVIVWRIHSEQVSVFMTMSVAASYSFLLPCILRYWLTLRVCLNTCDVDINTKADLLLHVVPTCHPSPKQLSLSCRWERVFLVAVDQYYFKPIIVYVLCPSVSLSLPSVTAEWWTAAF